MSQGRRFLRMVTGVYLLLSGLAKAEDATKPVVTVIQGSIKGISTTVPGVSSPVHKYLGIPFAAPPERFSPPTVPGPFVPNPYDASTLKPACIQEFNCKLFATSPFGGCAGHGESEWLLTIMIDPEDTRAFTIALFNNPPPASESEDCLYLNVFTPVIANRTAERSTLLPVMVWIYGGGLQFGYGGLPVYDGSSIAGHQGVLVVTFNYRTNVFGFPNSPELPRSKINLGFLDQRQALTWVQDNIASFGGDPSKVTIFGESAGGISVDDLITSSYYTPLFRAGIMQSGQDSSHTIAERQEPGFGALSWATLVSGLNCTNASSPLACVRAVDALTIKSVAEHAGLQFWRSTDNVTYVSNPSQRRKEGLIANVPILIGTNAQEGTVSTYGQSDINAYIQATFPGNETLQREVQAAYPVGRDGLLTNFSVIAQIETDFIFHCRAATLANISLAHYPTFRYFYNSSFANIQPFPELGVYHSSEIALVFGNLPPNATKEELALSKVMQKAWADFAKHPVQGPGWSEDVVAEFTVHGIKNVTAGELDQKCGLFHFDSP
ncbi:carboxylesterase hlo protein [Rutstroemia sp. NJR-2017a BVV2]|nr:carboxylesterase hlo protein [Rutstroemia sp. NJR-2017a BVV2]